MRREGETEALRCAICGNETEQGGAPLSCGHPVCAFCDPFSACYQCDLLSHESPQQGACAQPFADETSVPASRELDPRDEHGRGRDARVVARVDRAQEVPARAQLGACVRARESDAGSGEALSRLFECLTRCVAWSRYHHVTLPSSSDSYNKLQTCWDFLSAVNASDHRDYASIVSSPMFITRVEQRLKLASTTALESPPTSSSGLGIAAAQAVTAFLADLRLIHSNALLYNVGEEGAPTRERAALLLHFLEAVLRLELRHFLAAQDPALASLLSAASPELAEFLRSEDDPAARRFIADHGIVAEASASSLLSRIRVGDRVDVQRKWYEQLWPARVTKAKAGAHTVYVVYISVGEYLSDGLEKSVERENLRLVVSEDFAEKGERARSRTRTDRLNVFGTGKSYEGNEPAPEPRSLRNRKVDTPPPESAFTAKSDEGARGKRKRSSAAAAPVARDNPSAKEGGTDDPAPLPSMRAPDRPAAQSPVVVVEEEEEEEEVVGLAGARKRLRAVSDTSSDEEGVAPPDETALVSREPPVALNEVTSEGEALEVRSSEVVQAEADDLSCVAGERIVSTDHLDDDKRPRKAWNSLIPGKPWFLVSEREEREGSWICQRCSTKNVHSGGRKCSHCSTRRSRASYQSQMEEGPSREESSESEGGSSSDSEGGSTSESGGEGEPVKDDRNERATTAGIEKSTAVAAPRQPRLLKKRSPHCFCGKLIAREGENYCSLTCGYNKAVVRFVRKRHPVCACGSALPQQQPSSFCSFGCSLNHAPSLLSQMRRKRDGAFASDASAPAADIQLFRKINTSYDQLHVPVFLATSMTEHLSSQVGPAYGPVVATVIASDIACAMKVKHGKDYRKACKSLGKHLKRPEDKVRVLKLYQGSDNAIDALVNLTSEELNASEK